MSDQQSIQDFISKYILSATFQPAKDNPNMDSTQKMNHYKVIIRMGRSYGGLEFSVIFSQGLGIKHGPKLEDVLDCLASDASGYENVDSFEDWCQEYGYDTDSRMAEKIYHAVAEQAKQLEHFLNFASPEAYNGLLYQTEKL